MKKLSLYAFLVLILASCSEMKIDKALEKCATANFDYSKPVHLWENEAEFISINYKLTTIEDKIAALEKERNEVKKTMELAIEKFKKENKEPEEPPLQLLNPTEEEQAEAEKKWHIWSEWKRQLDNTELEFIPKLNRLYSEIKETRVEKGETRSEKGSIEKKIARKKIKKMNLDNKKKLRGFVNSFYKCENFYKRNKKTFMLRYGD